MSIPSCATKAQHDKAVASCESLQVKGLGAAAVDPFANVHPCIVKALPICPTLRAMTPKITFTPPTVADEPTPTDSEEPEGEGEPNYVMWGGLLLLLVAGGGYVAYKATRKG